MFDSNAQNSYVDTTFWEKQGGNTFVKAKTDWLNIGKVHLSFVRYNTETNKSMSSVEAAIPIGFKSGHSAFSLIADVFSGDILKKRAKSLEAQQASHAKYALPFFDYWGGSKGKSRRVTIGPGMRTAYVLQVQECEGIVTGKGTIQPKKDSQINYISVGLTDEDLKGFAVSMLALFSNYPGMFTFSTRLADSSVDMELPVEEYPDFAPVEDTAMLPAAQQTPTAAPVQTQAPVQVSAPAPVPAPPAPAVLVPVTMNPAPRNLELVFSYDQTGELFVVATRENYPMALKEGLRKLLHAPKPYKLTPERCAPLMEAVQNGAKALPWVVAVGKDESNNVENMISSLVLTVQFPPTGSQHEVVISYDQMGVMFAAATRENFIPALQDGVKKILQHSDKYVVPQNEYNALVGAIVSGNKELPITTAVSKTSKDKRDVIVSRVVAVET